MTADKPPATNTENRTRTERSQTAVALRTLALAVVVVSGAIVGVVSLTGTATAASSAKITASPDTVSATSTHTSSAEIEDEDVGHALKSIQIDYNSADNHADVENVSLGDVRRAGIDSDSDGELEVDLTDNLTDVRYDNNFHTIAFYFNESYELEDSDRVLVEYDDVVNPNEPGDYQIQISINWEQTDHPGKASLHVEESDETTSATAPEISNFTLSNPSGTNLEVRFKSNETLSDIAVDISGDADVTLTTSDFDEDDDNGYTYTATYDTGELGDYEATLTTAEDDDGNDGASGQHDSASVTCDDSDTDCEDSSAPAVGNFTLSNPSGTNLQVTLTANESLSNITVDVSGDANATLTTEDFQESYDDGVFSYTATYDPGAPGNYTATLTSAEDDSGNDGASGQSDSIELSDGGGDSTPTDDNDSDSNDNDTDDDNDNDTDDDNDSDSNDNDTDDDNDSDSNDNDTDDDNDSDSNDNDTDDESTDDDQSDSGSAGKSAGGDQTSDSGGDSDTTTETPTPTATPTPTTTPTATPTHAGEEDIEDDEEGTDVDADTGTDGKTPRLMPETETAAAPTGDGSDGGLPVVLTGTLGSLVVALGGITALKWEAISSALSQFGWP